MQAEIHGSIADIEGDRLVIGVALDVTEKQKALKKIREQEEFLRVLTENIADVLLIVDESRNLTYISGSIETVLGYKVEERQGKKAFETIHPEDRPALDDRLTAFAASGRFDRAAYRFRHKDGSWRILELSGSNLLDNPQIRGWLITASDITDRRRLEQEMEQLNRLTSLGRLSAQVAHEFNNVMMGIQTPVDLIRRRTAEDPQMLRFTEMISSSIARGKRITSDILRFGRPAQPALRSVDVHELLRKSAEEIKPLLSEDMKLELDLAATPLHIHADPSQISQVLINLSLNARDAMNGKGTLTIGARPGAEHTARSVIDLPNADEFVHISVCDTGEGISAENLPYIFEPLFTTKRTGTGLGLSVVYQVITGHGGHIFVDTKRGEGTTFHLFIPRAIESQATGVETPGKKEMLEPKIRVLIVEDEAAIATGLRWVLEAEGMIVHVVGTAAEVVPAINEFSPDVMVLDLSLPDGDGRAVYEEIDKPIPVIFSTGSPGEKDLPESGRGHVAVLRKPYATDDLLRMIHQVLSGGGHDA
jgi:two-component system cell cycle sensor histidine kinase/response regulator CckA